MSFATTHLEVELLTAFTPVTDRSHNRVPPECAAHSQPRTTQRRVPIDARDDSEEPLTEHKVAQRSKQIQFGIITPGYQNMIRLLESDPRLRNGGVLPLQPPAATLRVSKRAWDVLARKWRRALHLFDDVFIEGQDSQQTTLQNVVEEQRRKWVSPRNAHLPKEQRQKLSTDVILAARYHPTVPKKLPVEESMKSILKSPDCFEDIGRVVPESASSLTRGSTGVSPTDAGIKMFIAPSAETSLFNVLGASTVGTGTGGRSPSPSPDMPVTPSTIAQMRVTSPLFSKDVSAVSTVGGITGSTASFPPRSTSPTFAFGSASVSRLSPLAQPFQPPSAPTSSGVRDFSPQMEDRGAPSPSVRLESTFQQTRDGSSSSPLAPPPPWTRSSK